MSRDKQNEKSSLVLGWEFAYQNDRPCIVITEQIGNEIYILCSSFESAGKIELKGYRKASDVAEEIFAEIEKQLARYSHLHRYAEEAREVTEEYADGTPCEMTSVWEAISLHKNGWDDYETMCKLQDNIGNIEKSRLLKEFEGDIAELKKKYTESEDTE